MIKINKQELLNRIQDLQLDLDTAEMSLLTHCGWWHTSSTPDSVWVWEKEFDGKTLQVDRSRALSIEGLNI